MIPGVSVYPMDENLRLVRDPAPFSLPENSGKHVDEIWREEKSRRGRHIYNAPILTMVQRRKSLIHSRFVQYKEYIALRRRPDLFGGFEIFTLGVSGLVLSDDSAFFARRADHVTGYAGYYELIPSGGIDDRFLDADGRIDYIRQLLAELKEETGIDETHVEKTKALALIYDDVDRSYDLCVECVLAVSTGEALEIIRACSQNEYEPPIAVSFDDIGSFVGDKKKNVVPTSLALLELRGLLSRS